MSPDGETRSDGCPQLRIVDCGARSVNSLAHSATGSSSSVAGWSGIEISGHVNSWNTGNS